MTVATVDHHCRGVYLAVAVVELILAVITWHLLRCRTTKPPTETRCQHADLPWAQADRPRRLAARRSVHHVDAVPE